MPPLAVAPAAVSSRLAEWAWYSPPSLKNDRACRPVLLCYQWDMDRDLSEDLTARMPIVAHETIAGVDCCGCIIAAVDGKNVELPSPSGDDGRQIPACAATSRARLAARCRGDCLRRRRSATSAVPAATPLAV